MLVNWDIDFVGTVRSDRVPDDKNLVFKQTDKNIVRGDYEVFDNIAGNYNVVTWKDRKVVNIVTTLPTAWHMTRRQSHVGQIEYVKCPTTISLYIKNMGGTDRFDQMLVYY